MSMEKRARDTDRQQAVESLRRALAQGQLTQVEVDARAGRVQAAVTVGDIARELEDLQLEGDLPRTYAGDSAQHVVVRGMYFSEMPLGYKIFMFVVVGLVIAGFAFIAYMFITDGPFDDSWEDGPSGDDPTTVIEDLRIVE